MIKTDMKSGKHAIPQPYLTEGPVFWFHLLLSMLYWLCGFKAFEYFINVLAGHFLFHLYMSIFRKVLFLSQIPVVARTRRGISLLKQRQKRDLRPSLGCFSWWKLMRGWAGRGECCEAEKRELGVGGDWKTEWEGEIAAEKKREMGDTGAWWGLGSRGRKKRRNRRQNLGREDREGRLGNIDGRS